MPEAAVQEPATSLDALSGGGSSLDDLVKPSSPPKELTEKMTGIAKEKLAADEKAIGGMNLSLKQDRERVQKAFDATSVGPDALPQKWDADSEAKKYKTDPLESFGSFASVFAIAASAFTHAPMVNALNGSAAAMNAIKAGDEKAYDRAYTAWKDNTKLALDRQKMQQETYENSLKLMNTDLNAGRTQLEASAIRFGDKKTLAYLEMGMDKEMIDVMNARNNSALQIAQQLPDLERKHEMNKAYFELQNARKSGDEEAVKGAQQKINDLQSLTTGSRISPTARLEAQAIQDRIAKGDTPEEAYRNVKKGISKEAMLTDEAAEKMAEQYLAGDKTVLQNIGRGAQGSENIAKVKNRVAELMKERGISGADQAKVLQRYSGDTAYNRTAGTMGARVENATNEVAALLPLALDASEKLPRGKFVPLNEVQQAIRSGTSDPTYYQFMMQNMALAKAWGRAMNPQGVPRVQEQMEAKAVGALSTATSREAYKKMLEALVSEVEASRHATEKTRSGEKSEPLSLDKKKKSAPKAGDIEDGHVFKGGDPSKKENWEPAT